MEKRKRGRPAFYATPADLQRKVDEYFDDCAGELIVGNDGAPVLDRQGKPQYRGRHPPTMTGLAVYCGFTNRSLFARQKKRGHGFAAVVEQARLRVEQYAEMRLYDSDGYRGAVFTLQVNFGWNGNGVNEDANDNSRSSAVNIIGPY